MFASYRDPNTLQTLEKVRDASKETQIVLVKMDVRKKNEIEGVRNIIEDTVGDKGLNLLINNAGAFKWLGFPEITEEDLLFHFSNNAVGPVMVLKGMLPLLQKSAAREVTGMRISRAAVVNISALLGSMTELNDQQIMISHNIQAMGYRISKAALNMAMRVIANTVKDQGILVVNICPGWVKTDMGSERAHLEVEESINSMLKTFSLLNESHHAALLDRNGKTVPF
ncbi:c-factor [Trichonephila inaurata madagascariensis]|uniref:C-factor n=1 Tax=Trichonephila inaurata madagascariensis TaxID=2747483 RepID=A0A8X6XF31_9ARAC|nr:c-factor [Trichonephila inaurata madagascariensis]